VGEAFQAQARVQKGAGKALGSVIAEGDFRRAFRKTVLKYCYASMQGRGKFFVLRYELCLSNCTS